MIPGRNQHSAIRYLALCALLWGAASLTACETQQQRVVDREGQLAAAGFIIKPANTPERQQMLTRLPANQFVMRQNGDTIHFVYADPLVCGCLYVAHSRPTTSTRRISCSSIWRTSSPWLRKPILMRRGLEQLGSVGLHGTRPGPGFVYGPLGW